MKYRTPQAFRAALDHHVHREAEATELSLMRLRKRVAFERFLARLVVAAPDRWILKGAFALDIRLGLRTRATRDIDLVGHVDEAAVNEDLAAVASVELDDFLPSSPGGPGHSIAPQASVLSATPSPPKLPDA